MSASKLQLNEVTSASTIRACSNGDNPESAIELLRALQQKAVRQNVVTYTSAMAACHRDQFLWPWSLWLLSNMKDDAVEMDIGLFNAAMGVCRQAHGFGHLRKRNIGQVEQLFKDVQYHRLNPDVVTYSHVMAAVREAGEWERVLEVLDEALSSNLQADSQLYTNAIAACADAASWQSALHLLGIATAVGPSEHHWSAAMTACSDATQWQYALLLARGMTDIHLTPGVVSYTAMMSACTHGGMWQSTLRLLDMLQAAGEAPNYVTMTAVIKACMTNTNWTFALHWKSILDKLGVSGYFTTYTYLIWLCAEAEKWDWVEYLMAESTTRFPNAENFDQRQFYNLVHLKCLKLGDCSQALGFWKDCRAAGISSCNALLATCEVAMDWDEWVDGCGKLGPTGWVMDVIPRAEKDVQVLGYGKDKGHGPGWQRDCLGQVALTLDLLSWHGLASKAAPIKRHFEENVLIFVVQAVIAETDKSVLQRAGTTHTRMAEPILKGKQLQSVMLSEDLTKTALLQLQLAQPRQLWMSTAQLMVRRQLPADAEEGPVLLDDPSLHLQARYIAYRSEDAEASSRGHSRGFIALGADAGCRTWLAPFSLDNGLAAQEKHVQLLSEVVSAAGLDGGQVRLYLSYVPSLASLATLYQLHSQKGVQLQVAFNTWRETRMWTTEAPEGT